MDTYRILLIPTAEDDLIYEWETHCKDLEAAKSQARAYLSFAGDKFKSATILTQWKSELSFRQATDIIFNNFNL